MAGILKVFGAFSRMRAIIKILVNQYKFQLKLCLYQSFIKIQWQHSENVTLCYCIGLQRYLIIVAKQSIWLIMGFKYKTIRNYYNTQQLLYKMSKQKNSGLGKSIINKIKKKEFYSDPTAQFSQPTEQKEELEKAKKLRSILEQNSLEEFLAEAVLSSKNFQAKRDIKMKQIRPQLESKRLKQIDEKEQTELLPNQKEQILSRMRIPRKPQWSTEDSRDGYIQKQNQAFLDWRRKLAQVEESQLHLKLTPFQRNIEVWKQLWRVVQRAHILIQIVDVRDILFYRCEDLQKYVKQVDPNKIILLLINKSDLATEEIREKWSDYLSQIKVNFIFFSAKIESARVDTQQQKTQFEINTKQIANTHQLVTAIKQLSKDVKLGEDKILQVGMVGYPNVGKSSVINSLLQKKKVGVASQPGKTKHYQTLFLTPQILLVDCPGLVFPNVASSVAEMVLNGVVLIDTIKDYESPMQLFVRRVPKKAVVKRYGIKYAENQPYNASLVLQKYSTMRGFFGGSGVPNEAKASRVILKDYTTGQIKYCRMPPGTENQLLWQHYLADEEVNNEISQTVTQQKKQIVTQTQQKLDNKFFTEQKTQVSSEDMIKELTMDDMLDLVDGKTANGIKLPKQLRREVKFAIKRGQTLDVIKSKYLLQGKVIDSGHKKMIKT